MQAESTPRVQVPGALALWDDGAFPSPPNSTHPFEGPENGVLVSSSLGKLKKKENMPAEQKKVLGMKLFGSGLVAARRLTQREF